MPKRGGQQSKEGMVMSVEKMQPAEATERLDKIFDRAKGLGKLCTRQSFSNAGYRFETPWTALAPEDQYGGEELATWLRMRKSLVTVHGQEGLDSLAIQSSLASDMYLNPAQERTVSKSPGLLAVIHNRLAYAAVYDGRREPIYVTPNEPLLIPRVEEILDLSERTFDQA